MWYECQWDNSTFKSQIVKVNHYRSKYGLLHRALAHTEQQPIKGPKNELCLKKNVTNYTDCEIVDTLTNVALWKESRQDSIPPNASLAERGPQLGNDGNIDTIGTNYVCAHTGFDSEYFWWTVNFEKEYIIEKVKIYGRTDCCSKFWFLK